MFFKCSKCCFLLFTYIITASALYQSVNNLTPKQRSRIMDSYKKDRQKEISIFDKRSRRLFEIIHSRPENVDIEFEPCKIKPLKIPDMSASRLRISDVKCLEYLWKMRYYDEAILALIHCDDYYDSDLLKVRFGGIGGVPGEFAHVGAIGWQTLKNTWLFMCDGALISEKYALTTVRCTRIRKQNILLSDASPKVMRFGVVDISDKEEVGKSPHDIFIRKIIVHPNYSAERYYYDIALIELDREIVFSTQVHPACIWTDLRNVDGNGVLTGWNVVESNKTVKAKEYVINSFDVFGRLDMINKSKAKERGKDDGVIQSALQFSKVHFISNKKCESLTESKRKSQWRGLLNHQLCAGKTRPNERACQVPDLGTVLQASIKYPEVSDWKMHFVIGVRSFSFDCKISYPVSIYTRASTFLDWIENIVWEKDSNLARNSSFIPQ